MRKEFEMTQEEMNKILDINKEGGDPVMFISGGIPIGKSLQDKVDDYWDTLGIKYGFNPRTVRGPGSKGKLSFTAELLKQGEQ